MVEKINGTHLALKKRFFFFSSFFSLTPFLNRFLLFTYFLDSFSQFFTTYFLSTFIALHYSSHSSICVVRERIGFMLFVS